MAEADTGLDFGDILSNIDSAAETAGNLANKVIAFRSAEAKRNLDQTLANTQAQAQVNVAQAPIKKGAFDLNTLLILLTLAGLAIAAVSIVRSRKGTSVSA